MDHRHTLYGWQVSYFTGKVRCYLEWKGVPWTEVPPNLWTLTRTIRSRTGAAVMPVLVTPDGEWLQDSSVIIDALEARHPQRPVLPDTPVQRFFAYLLEAWGDEWWVPVAMHTRWSHPENFDMLFRREVGDHLLPGFPRPLKNLAVGYIAGYLRGVLPRVGIRPEQLDWLDRCTVAMLDKLDTHFGACPYLLGARPTLADFGLVGTMYGHLGRDPWPARELIAPRPRLRAWIDRMAAAPSPGALAGALQPDDALPPTLAPVLETLLAEFVPMLEGIAAQVCALQGRFATGVPLPRGLRDVVVPSAHGEFRRVALPYTLWMAQRVLDAHAQLAPDGQAAVREALRRLGGERLLALRVPRLERHDLRVAFAA